MKKTLLSGIGITAVMGLATAEAMAGYSTMPVDRIIDNPDSEQTAIILSLEDLAIAAPTLIPVRHNLTGAIGWLNGG